MTQELSGRGDLLVFTDFSSGIEDLVDRVNRDYRGPITEESTEDVSNTDKRQHWTET